MNCRRNVDRGAMPSAVPYCRAVARSILRETSFVWLSFGTVTRTEVLTSSLLVGWKRCGSATLASSVSYGK